MKITTIGLLLLMLTLIGCSSLVVGSGKYHDVLQYDSTRSAIRERIGPPHGSGVVDQQKAFREYDWFVIHGRAVPNDMDMAGYVQGVGLTLGLADVILLPISLVMVPLDCRKEHNLWVYYDKQDHYMFHQSDCWPFAVETTNTSLHGSTESRASAPSSAP